MRNVDVEYLQVPPRVKEKVLVGLLASLEGFDNAMDDGKDLRERGRW